jgi:hypothetical protein
LITNQQHSIAATSTIHFPDSSCAALRGTVSSLALPNTGRPREKRATAPFADSFNTRSIGCHGIAS